MYASQIADEAALHLIQAEHTELYMFYLALCVVEEMPGVLRELLCNDGMSSAQCASNSITYAVLNCVKLCRLSLTCVIATDVAYHKIVVLGLLIIWLLRM